MTSKPAIIPSTNSGENILTSAGQTQTTHPAVPSSAPGINHLTQNDKIALIFGISLLGIAALLIIAATAFILARKKRGYTKIPSSDCEEEEEEHELADFSKKKHFIPNSTVKETELYNEKEILKHPDETTLVKTTLPMVFREPTDTNVDDILSDDSHDPRIKSDRYTKMEESEKQPVQTPPMEASSFFSIQGIRKRIIAKSANKDETPNDGFIPLRRTSSLKKISLAGFDPRVYDDFKKVDAQKTENCPPIGYNTSSGSPLAKLADENDDTFFVDEKTQLESDLEDDDDDDYADNEHNDESDKTLRGGHDNDCSLFETSTINRDDLSGNSARSDANQFSNTLNRLLAPIQSYAVPDLPGFIRIPSWLNALNRANPGIVVFSIGLRMHRRSKKNGFSAGLGGRSSKKNGSTLSLLWGNKKKSPTTGQWGSQPSVNKIATFDTKGKDDPDLDGIDYTKAKVSQSWVDLVFTLHQARCIYGGHVNPIAGRYYIKVRLLPADLQPSMSVMSLASVDQLSTKLISPFEKAKQKLKKNQNKMLTAEFPKEGVTSRFPSRVAFRSIVYDRRVRLKLPKHWFFESANEQDVMLLGNNADQGANANISFSGDSDVVKRTPTAPRLVLQVDLKEFQRNKSRDLTGGYLATTTHSITGEGLARSFGFNGGQKNAPASESIENNCLDERRHAGYMPLWRKATTVASVRVPLTPAMWYHLAQGLASTMRFPAVERPLSKSNEGYKGNNHSDISAVGGDSSRRKTVVLRFLREWTPKFEGGTGSRGTLSVGLQYIPEQGKLTIRLIKCSDIIFPRDCETVFVRVSLVTNTRLIGTSVSPAASKLSLHAAEFCPTGAGSAMVFNFEESEAHVCLVFTVMSSSATSAVFDTLLDSAMNNHSGSSADGEKNLLSGGNGIAAKFAKLARQAGLGEANMIGRCTIGAAGLAYGSGEKHWRDVTTKRGLIKYTHVLV